MVKLSFQQLLVIAFLVITLTLGITSVQSMQTLGKLSKDMQDAARLSIVITENAQHVEELTVTMERTARQFLVLDDPVFRERYRVAWREADAALNSLVETIPDFRPETVREWKSLGDAGWHIVSAGDRNSEANERTLSTIFSRLPQLNASIALDSKREIARRNDVLLGELKHQQFLLAIQVFAAISLTAFTTLGVGMWLSHTLKVIESAIEQLGQSRFDQKIDIGGPENTRRLGQTLNWLRSRLAELDADKMRFVRHISHELKTPLAALREGVALLEDEIVGPLTTRQSEVTAILHHNTLALQTQIEDLLRFNEAASGAQQLELSQVDVKPLLLQTIEEQRLQWQARALLIDVTGASAVIEADAKKLSIVFANLLSNAVRFSSSRGKVVFVLTRNSGFLTIDCIDRGIGIAAAEAKRIFEPFYQGANQPAGARKGNGIGLSIVREYIEAHAGQIRVLPHDGGAHFQIHLPYEKK